MIVKQTIVHRSILWKTPKEEMEKVVKSARFLGDILRHYGLSNVGGNPITLKDRLKHDNIDYSHIQTSSSPGKSRKDGSWNKGTKAFYPRISREECLCSVLINDSKFHYKTAKRCVLKYNLIEYKCRDCGLTNKWNNKSITLELEHIDGNRQNHSLENLCFLCPNCHSQTPTFRGRKNKKNFTAK